MSHHPHKQKPEPIEPVDDDAAPVAPTAPDESDYPGDEVAVAALHADPTEAQIEALMNAMGVHLHGQNLAIAFAATEGLMLRLASQAPSKEYAMQFAAVLEADAKEIRAAVNTPALILPGSRA